jgi:hypothetical protein
MYTNCEQQQNFWSFSMTTSNTQKNTGVETNWKEKQRKTKEKMDWGNWKKYTDNGSKSLEKIV